MKKRPRSAKALVFIPLFRCRQEAAKKGKGSYNRRPRNPQQDSGPSHLWTAFTNHGISSFARTDDTKYPSIVA